MNEDIKNSIELKVILLGASGVGKTSFVKRYIHKHYKENPSTIGASFILKIWKSHKIAIWDTSGEERYRSLSKYYSRGAGAVVMAFDLTNPHSFTQLEQNFVPLLENALENRIVAVVGMKADLIETGSDTETAKNKVIDTKKDKSLDIQSEIKPDNSLDIQSEIKPDNSLDIQSEIKPDNRPDTQSEIKPDNRPDTFRIRATQLLTLLNPSHSPQDLYFETSSLIGNNVDGVFETLFTAAFHNPPQLPSLSSKIALSSLHEINHQRCSC